MILAGSKSSTDSVNSSLSSFAECYRCGSGILTLFVENPCCTTENCFALLFHRMFVDWKLCEFN